MKTEEQLNNVLIKYEDIEVRNTVRIALGAVEKKKAR